MNRSRPTLPKIIFCSAFAAAGVLSRAQPLPQASPFLPPTGPSANSPADAKYQLGGMIVQGSGTLVSITRLSDKQSFWVPVGGTVNEVTILAYNSDLDQASVSANGERFTLTLRKSIVLTGTTSDPVAVAGGPVATPPLPPPSGPPEVQEREARMLVTDLLDIGQQHRKAYEEAQRKAAAEKKPQ